MFGCASHKLDSHPRANADTVFLTSGRPRGPGRAFQKVRDEAPYILKVFLGPPARPDLKNATPKNQARLRSGNQ